MDNNNLLVAKNVSKSFGSKVALNDFSLNIPRGTIYGLLGPNGAGKTTFIRIINQITMPDTGEVLLNGEKLQAKHISKIGYMPEERGLYKNMKVGEQVVYLAQLKGLSHNDAVKKLKYWFDKLDIGDWWNKKLSELSKGMGQKIQFIVTVLHEPELLIFDEPFSGFDPVNANLIRDEIIELKNNGATIIFSTHRMESVEEMCDHIALINKGNKVLDGPMLEVQHQFKDNTYMVEIQTDNDEAMKRFLELQNVENVQARNGIFAFRLLHGEVNQGQLLQNLTQIGTVLTFKEEIPTMNEVFINAVKN